MITSHCRWDCEGGGGVHDFIGVALSKLVITKDSTLAKNHKSNTATRLFCNNCGCSIDMQFDEEKHTFWFCRGELMVIETHRNLVCCLFLNSSPNPIGCTLAPSPWGYPELLGFGRYSISTVQRVRGRYCSPVHKAEKTQIPKMLSSY